MANTPVLSKPSSTAKPKIAKLYNVHLVPKEGVDEEQIKARMDLCLDWYKYGTDSWLVKTNISLPSLNLRFKPLVEPGGFLLIFEVQPTQYKGWMPKKFWAWVKDVMEPKPTK